MKLISFAVPCYNSAAYMEKCIDSLLVFKEDVEIIIVNDGSSDDTKKIANRYVKEYPDCVRAIHKENGGHGSGVNAGLVNAKGLYYKVVDSDDWVDVDAYEIILNFIKKIQKEKTEIDMIIANYVYEHERTGQKVIHYKNVMPVEQIFSWDDTKKFHNGQYLLMHSVFYRTKLVQEIDLKLPEKTFYVDNIFVYYPLPHIKTMYYLDVDFYRYFIGRDDQSVNEVKMIERIDQQLLVTKSMTEFYHLDTIENDRCRKYMMHYLTIMYVICSSLEARSKKKENKVKIKTLWSDLKAYDKKMYHKLRYRSLAFFANLPNFIVVPGYKIAQKIFKFN